MCECAHLSQDTGFHLLVGNLSAQCECGRRIVRRTKYPCTKHDSKKRCTDSCHNEFQNPVSVQL